MKKSFANSSKSALALIVSIMLGGLFAQVNAQTAPSTYSAYTGTDVKAVPPAPALGPANSVVTDPTFGSQILRVTDANTNGGESFISTDAGDIRAWNANSTGIKLTGPHGDGYWLEFDPTNFKVGNGSSNPKIHSVPFGATWAWSAIDPDTIYYLSGNQIAKYNKSTGVSTNLGGPSTGEAVDYMAVVVGQDNWVCSAAGPGQQDTYTKVFCLNPVSPSTSKYIDVVNKTVNGVAQSDPNWPTSAAGQTLGIHGMSGGTGANWVAVTFHQQSWGGNGDSAFDLATNTWSLVKGQTVAGGDIYWGGHISVGNGIYANASGSQDGKDSRGMLLRNPDALMNASQYKFVGQPPAPSNGWCDADHSSWQNSLSNPNAPILQSRYGGSSACAFAWTGEIIGIAVDGSNTVWRFAHNHNNGFQCYYGQSFAQISNDGKWALFSSYWDGGLGADTAFGCSSRIDTFIVALVPGAGGSTGGSSSGSTGGSSSGSTGGGSSGNSGSSGSSGSSSGSSGTGSGSTGSGGTNSGATTRVEQNGPGVTYTGNWSTSNQAAASGGSAVLAMDANSAATLAFNGTGATWIGYQDQWSGIAQVYVDGALKTQVDTYSSTAKAQSPLYTVSGLTNGAHTMSINVLGQKSASSSGAWVWVDAFDVVSGGSSVTSGSGSGTSNGTGTSLKASYLGATGEDYVGPQGQLSPDGVPDWHIHLQGLRSTPVMVRIVSTAGGVWQTPYNGLNWVIAAKYGAAGSGDLFFAPWSTSGFHVKVWYSDSTTDEADTLQASYLGATGQDFVGPQGQLTPNGVPDWHIHLQGLGGTPVQVQITSTAGGVWRMPFNGLNWVISTQYDGAGGGDLFFEPWSSPGGFHVKVWYSDSTTDEADVRATPATSTLKASWMGATGQDYVGPGGQLTPNGVPDWHIQLQGLRGTPALVRITDKATGVWEMQYNRVNWVISTQYGASGSGDLFFEPWDSPGGFHVIVVYSDSTMDEADVS